MAPRWFAGGGALLSGTQQIGAYEVLFELGRGGMGRVYLGRIVGAGGFERMVAIKRAHPELSHGELSERFMNEARLAAYVHHANVVGTHQAGRDEHGHYLICDYVEGGSLAGLMERARGGGKVPAAIVARIVLDGLAGLHAAHEATDPAGTPLHMLHRDVSVDNLLVGRDGVTRLADFGIAKSVLSPILTEEGLRHGKLIYFPPEYLRAGPVDRTLDIYAMGVTLWAGLAGHEPWESKDEAQILHAIHTEGLPRLSVHAPELPQAFEAVIQRACQRDRAQRYQTARQMSVALEQLAQRGAMRIATHAQVAEYVEAAIGPELAARRDRVRARRLELAAPSSRGEALPGAPSTQPAGASTTSIDSFVPQRREPLVAAPAATPTPAASLELPSLQERGERGPHARNALRSAAFVALLLVVAGGSYALLSSSHRPEHATLPAVRSAPPVTDPRSDGSEPVVGEPRAPVSDGAIAAENDTAAGATPPALPAEPSRAQIRKSKVTAAPENDTAAGAAPPTLPAEPSAVQIRKSKVTADEKHRPAKARSSADAATLLPDISTHNPYR